MTGPRRFRISWRIGLLATAIAGIVLSRVAPASARATPQDVPIDRLVERFKTTSPFWRQADVAKEIAGLKNPQALTALASWLTHEDRHIRANVAFVFAALGDPRGLQALEAIIDDRSDRSEGQGIPGAKWSLAKQILSDRYYAVHVLGELKDKSSLGILVRLLADEQVNYKAIWALGEIGDARAIPPVIRMLQDRDAHTRITAIQTLETLHAREALPDLRAMVDDPALPNAGDQIPVGQVAARAIAVLEKRR